MSAQRVIVVTAIAVTAAYLTIPPVLGGNYGSNNPDACDSTFSSQCVANNGSHTVMEIIDSAAIETDLLLVMNHVYDPQPDVSMKLTTSDRYDVRVSDVYAQTGFWGWVICPSTAETGGSGLQVWCLPQWLYFNNGAFPSKYDTSQERKSLASHELGHTMGLRHPTSSTNGGSNWASSPMVANQTANIHLTDHDKAILDLLYELQ